MTIIKEIEQIEQNFLRLTQKLKDSLNKRVIVFERLNKKQQEFFDLIADNEKNPLTYPEILQETGLSSNSHAIFYFKTLHKKGFIDFRSNKDYTINWDFINLVNTQWKN
jgi:hypothetical protein